LIPVHIVPVLSCLSATAMKLGWTEKRNNIHSEYA
jgi:hypothetical protein